MIKTGCARTVHVWAYLNCSNKPNTGTTSGQQKIGLKSVPPLPTNVFVVDHVALLLLTNMEKLRTLYQFRYLIAHLSFSSKSLESRGCGYFRD